MTIGSLAARLARHHPQNLVCGDTPPTGRLDRDDANLWLTRARRGDFEGAWHISDRIRERAGNARDWTIPRHLQRVWDGTAIAGRRVLIRCYHGLGDTIQFIRYAPWVRDVANEVSVWVQPQLLPLLETVGGIDRLLPLHDGTPEVDYDVDVEVMELPYVFRTTLPTIPATVPYVFAKPLVLSDSRTPRIGLVWRAGLWDERRSIPFSLIARLFDRREVTLYQLQHETTNAERHPSLRRLNTSSLLRTARCMRGMDLVITIDSMPAHLAGALGTAVWTLLPCDADWRWMEDRTDSPWYPTMRLFRQQRTGSWESVIDEVIDALDTEFLPAAADRNR